MTEKNKTNLQNNASAQFLTKEEASFKALPHRTVEWLGSVNHDNLEHVVAEIKHLMVSSSTEEIHLLVNSGGGATGIGMSFYDAMTGWLKPKLVTIGSGDVDSSGIIIFLSGEKRYVTKNTTMLFHLAGRTFGTDKRFTVNDMKAMLTEDSLKDYQYASVVSERTGGTYSPEDILDLMVKNTIVTPQEAVRMGLAHEILG
jgi:ATP-dependent Clp protease protease subunit